MNNSPKHYDSNGFTLIELVMVITLMAIIAATVTPILTRPFANYQIQYARQELVSLAQSSVDKISQEIKQALPNTIRISSDGSTLEFILIEQGGRYRSSILSGDNSALSPSQADSRFTILGLYGTYNNDGARLSLYNTSVSTFYTQLLQSTDQTTVTAANNNVQITPLSVTTCITDCSQSANSAPIADISLSRPHQFDSLGFGSPKNRIFLFTTGVIYQCSTDIGAADGSLNIYRYQNYDFKSDQADLDTRAEIEASAAEIKSLLSQKLSQCEFSYTQGNSTRSGVIDISITMQNEVAGTITLLKQVLVQNAP
ncbi:MAG: type II secretion system protein [Saccharospirillaceae bacterium]|nr:type II secretion system GspH family protein [Pseudomonadales bacterium]NRB77905.1 type II secretion system protein [Saccharospirillaceae bacterium]